MAMPSLTTTWSPSCCQLRLALAGGRRSPPPASLRLRIRMHSVSDTWSSRSSVPERRRSVESWAVNVDSSTSDGYAGWTDGEEESTDSSSKKSRNGLVGAGIAGVVLVAGLSFAALSVRNGGTSKKQMEPLTAHQEESLASDHYNDETVEDSKNQAPDGSNQLTSLDEDLYSRTENIEAVETRNGDGADKGDESIIADGSDKTHLQQENGSSIDDQPVAPEELPQQPESEFSPGSLANSSSENDKVNLTTLDLERQSELELEGDNSVTESSLLNDDSSNISIEPKGQNEEDYDNVAPELQPGGNFEPTVTDQGNGSSSANTDVNFNMTKDISPEQGEASTAFQNPAANEASEAPVADVSYSFPDKQLAHAYQSITETRTSFDLTSLGIKYSTQVIPAPSNLSPTLQEFAGKVLVSAAVDQVQSQALTALQVLKVIEADVQPGDLCTRREYARWLVSASSSLTRSSVSKVYPAMYIENVTELGFDDITPEDPDFPFIQGLAEAGLISSKLSRSDMQSSPEDDPQPAFFFPDSPLSRQDLVSWKMALEKKQLPIVDREIVQQLSGFIDIDKINPDAWPAIVSDIAAGDQGITALSFGYTRLFQPDKPVTTAQAAIALATGEASEIVGEELARIEAESMAEKVVAAHNALVAEVEQDVNASYEKELQLEREKIGAVQKLAEEAKQEIEKLRAEREDENLLLLKERAAVDSEMEVFTRLRHEMEEQLQTLMSSKVEIAYEKERLVKLRKDAETENQEITRLQYELEVERKALSLARSWAEDEARRAIEQAKSLDEARDRWAGQGIKVVVDDDLREEANVEATWVAAANESFATGSVDRAENLVDRLKNLAKVVMGKAKDTIEVIIQTVLSFISRLKELISTAGSQAGELKGTAVSKLGELKDTAAAKFDTSLQEVQQGSVHFTSVAKDGIKRFAGDCRLGVEKISQKFRT